MGANHAPTRMVMVNMGEISRCEFHLNGLDMVQKSPTRSLSNFSEGSSKTPFSRFRFDENRGFAHSEILKPMFAPFRIGPRGVVQNGFGLLVKIP